MNNDAITARIAVIEIFSMMALGLYLANASNDPDFKKAEALLGALQSAVALQPLPESIAPIAQQYADQLIANLRNNLSHLRGQVARAH